MIEKQTHEPALYAQSFFFFKARQLRNSKKDLGKKLYIYIYYKILDLIIKALFNPNWIWPQYLCL